MEELRLKLIDDLNSSGLPLEAIMFVVRDVYRDVQEAFKDYQIQKAKMPKQEESIKDIETEIEGTE